MILAAGLSPAWQQILVFDEFRVGEVNRAAETHACASGKVINVGLALFHLGADSRTLTVVGGATIRDEFAENNIPATWIETGVPTRTCTTILDRSTGVTTELVENASKLEFSLQAARCASIGLGTHSGQPEGWTPTGTPSPLDDFAAAFGKLAASADVVVITGSSPPGTPLAFYRDLLRQTPVRCVLDIRGDELLAALETRPFVVKPNREELAATLRRDLANDDDLLATMRELNGRGAEWVVVTDGSAPVWMTSKNETIRVQPATVDVVNPIGCGDCMAAGIAWGIAQDLAPAEWLRLGIAAAAENAAQLLPARLDPQRVRSWAESLAIV